MNQERLLAVLDLDLREQARDLTPYGVKEYCFPAKLGRKVLSQLLRHQVVVLGGDLWIANNDGSFEPGHDNWYANRQQGASFEDISTRIVQWSDAFFKRNENNESNMVTFVIA